MDRCQHQHQLQHLTPHEMQMHVSLIRSLAALSPRNLPSLSLSVPPGPAIASDPCWSSQGSAPLRPAQTVKISL